MFAAHSKELLILWSPLYLSRAWCVYELAMYMTFRKGGTVNVCLILKVLTILTGVLCAGVSCLCYELTLALQSSMVTSGLNGVSLDDENDKEADGPVKFTLE